MSLPTLLRSAHAGLQSLLRRLQNNQLQRHPVEGEGERRAFLFLKRLTLNL